MRSHQSIGKSRNDLAGVILESVAVCSRMLTWIDHSKTKVGYEIPLNRHFYRYEPPRALEDIAADVKELESEIVAMLAEIVGSAEDLK